jgi:hypothetical protein
LAIIKADAKWQRNRTWSAPRAALKIHFGNRYPCRAPRLRVDSF